MSSSNNDILQELHQRFLDDCHQLAHNTHNPDVRKHGLAALREQYVQARNKLVPPTPPISIDSDDLDVDLSDLTPHGR